MVKKNKGLIVILIIIVVAILSQGVKKEAISGPSVSCADCEDVPCTLYSKPSSTFGTTYCLTQAIGTPCSVGWNFVEECNGGACECNEAICDDYCLGNDLYICDGCNFDITTCPNYCQENYDSFCGRRVGGCVDCLRDEDCIAGKECVDGFCEVAAAVCTDSDAGKNAYIKGTTTGLFGGSIDTKTDICTKEVCHTCVGESVNEYYCSDGTLFPIGTMIMSTINCNSGDICQNGACQQEPVCSPPCPPQSTASCGEYIVPYSGCFGPCPAGNACPGGQTCNPQTGQCSQPSVCDPSSSSDVYCEGTIAHFCSQGQSTTLDCAATGEVCTSESGPVIFCSDCNTNADCPSGQTCTPGHSCIPPTCIDNDGDGYGIIGKTQGCQFTQVDCNDNNIAVHPRAHEFCNDIDDDCDGTKDEGCADCEPSWTCTPWSDLANNCGTRTCTDVNQCGKNEGRPNQVKPCEEEPPGPDACENKCLSYVQECDEATGECKTSGFIWMIGIFLAVMMVFKMMGGKQ